MLRLFAVAARAQTRRGDRACHYPELRTRRGVVLELCYRGARGGAPTCPTGLPRPGPTGAGTGGSGATGLATAAAVATLEGVLLNPSRKGGGMVVLSGRVMARGL